MDLKLYIWLKNQTTIDKQKGVFGKKKQTVRVFSMKITDSSHVHPDYR